MLGHERSLVRRYQGRPFALLGVSGEDSREALAAVQRREGLSWRNCWDGRGGPMKLRPGRKGWFLGCAKFPRCRGTREAPADVLEQLAEMGGVPS